MTIPSPSIITKYRARDTSDRKGQPIKAIIIHATVGTNSLKWLMGNEKGTSIHVLIMKDGTSYQMADDTVATHHVGFSRMVLDGKIYDQNSQFNCNHITLGIELENLNDGKDAYPPSQLQAAAWWIWHWRSKYGALPVLPHRAIDQHGKTDPAGITIDDILHFIDEPIEPVSTPIDAIVPEIDLIAPPRATVLQAYIYLTKRGTDTSYTPQDVQLITNLYWGYAQLVHLDPLIAFAQMVHETGGLTSWWSLRPRRNPAGLGVTGETSRNRNAPGKDWAFDTVSKLYKRGYSFANWDTAIRAHLGHLLLYAVPTPALTGEQQKMIQADPRAAVFPPGYRGIAQTLQELEGRWAVPGNEYADRIAAIAQQIRNI